MYLIIALKSKPWYKLHRVLNTIIIIKTYLGENNEKNTICFSYDYDDCWLNWLHGRSRWC